MPCSAITLSLATICSVVSVALLAIAFGTDNWQFIKVERTKIETKLSGPSRVETSINWDQFSDVGLFFTHTKGLFRVCYPEDRPKGEELYLSPVETDCSNIDYYIFDENKSTAGFSVDQMTRLHMARSMIALFIVSFFLVFVAFWTGVAGCWRRSPGNIASTAILMLLACLFAAGAMGLWHGVEYYEETKLTMAPFKASWDPLLTSHSSMRYDWSYMVAWVGTGLMLVAFALFLGGSQCMQREAVREQSKQMQYVMPVYPQKQQQYPATYGYGYPGPYHYGSQYGPYNY